MKNYLSLLFITSFLFFYSCKKEVRILQLETNQYEIHGDSIKLIGEILSMSDEEIMEFGFLMDMSTTPCYVQADSTYLINKKPELGIYSYPILNNIDEDKTFLIRFFAKTASDVVYGSQISIQGNGKIAPVITDFMPKSGYDGDIVKIFGKHFNSGKYIFVNLGDENMEIIERTNESLLVKIPDYIYREELSFKVYLNGHTVESDELFLLQGPYITDFTPESGSNTTEIILYGENFAKTTWHNLVVLGTEKAEVIEISATGNSLKIKLYTHTIPAGDYKFVISAGGKSSVSDKTFQIISPWIHDSQIPSEDGISKPVVLTTENKIYLITGSTNSISSAGYSKSIFEYDLNTKSWSQKSNFPGERRTYAAGFTINGKGYIGTGKGYHSNLGLSDFWEYDFQNDLWSQKNDFPGIRRAGAIGFTYEGNGYFLFGSKNTDFWKYNHNDDTWVQMPSFEGHKRAGANHIIIGDDLYIVGGGDPNTPFEADIWKFSFANNNWSFVDFLYDFPMKIFKSDGKTYILERKTNHVFGVNQTFLYEFDIVQNIKIKQLEIFPGTDRSASSFIAVKNGILYFGCGGPGINGVCLKDVWTYPLNNNNNNNK